MKIKVVKNPILKIILLICGFICVFLGVLGIPLPVLPTTPFLILAALCFSYSSENFYNKVVNSKHFGKSVNNYLEGRGIPLRAKIVAFTCLWVSLGLSIWLVQIFWLRILLPVVGAFVTWFILREPNTEDFSEDRFPNTGHTVNSDPSADSTSQTREDEDQ